MALIEQINHDMITAAKQNETLKRDTLRLLKTAVTNAEIAKGQPLTDEEITDVIAKEVKQRQEAEASFTAGNRGDLAGKEAQERAILLRYLPEQLSEGRIVELVANAISQTQASSPADMGKVMAVLVPQIRGKVDASLVSRLVKERLGVSG